MTLGGAVCTRDCERLDYPWKECVQSILPVCDSVVLCDSGSTDGTLEAIQEWIKREPKLLLCHWPWPNPVGDVEFYFRWINHARQHVPCDYHLQIDADEVVSEHSYGTIQKLKERSATDRFAVICNRLNFWKSARFLIPPGVCLGHEVIRIAPTNMVLASDGAHAEGTQAPRIAKHANIDIHHFGFLRRPAAYFEKSKLLHGYFFGSYDKRLMDAESDTAQGGNWMEAIRDVEWTDRLIPYSGPWPVVAHQWLHQHGFEP